MLFLGLVAIPGWSQTQDNNTPYRPILFNNSDGITTSFVPAPAFSGAGGNSSTNSPWLKVELHYSVTPKSTSAGGNFVPSATFKIWIEGRDLYDTRGQPGQGIAVVLTGSATYVNLPAGRDGYACFFVHPNTLARYSTSNGYTDFDRLFNIHVEVDIDGQISDYFDKKQEQDANWYTKPTPVGGMVYRQDQCAFLLDSPTKYPGLQIPADGGSAPAPAPAASATPPAPLPPAAPPAPAQ